MQMKRGAMVAALGAASYVVGDVLMLGGVKDAEANPVIARDDVDEDMGVMISQPSWALRTGALSGVLATPLYMFGVWDMINSVSRKSNGDFRPTAIMAGTLLMSGHCLASFIHGSFYHLGEAYKRADEALLNNAPEEQIGHLVAQAKQVGKAIIAPYATYLVVNAVGSAVLGRDIAKGRSHYPTWAALVIPPALPIIVCFVGVQLAPISHERVKNSLRGAGISLGIMASFIATALVPKRRD